MKKDLLTVKELAAELRMSAKSIQRAYRKGEIPVQWLSHISDGALEGSTRSLDSRPIRSVRLPTRRGVGGEGSCK